MVSCISPHEKEQFAWPVTNRCTREIRKVGPDAKDQQGGEFRRHAGAVFGILPECHDISRQKNFGEKEEPGKDHPPSVSASMEFGHTTGESEEGEGPDVDRSRSERRIRPDPL